MCVTLAAAASAIGGMSAGTAVAVGAAGAMAASALAKPKTPGEKPVVDPAVERAKADTEAAAAVNSKLAAKNRSRAASSLLAKPIDTTTSEVSALGGGKTTLGQ
jgi:hypothetical protein